MITFKVETDEVWLRNFFMEDGLINTSLIDPVNLTDEELTNEIFVVCRYKGEPAGIVRLHPVGPRMFNIHIMVKKQFFGRDKTEAMGREFFNFLNRGYGPCLLIANIVSKFRLAKAFSKAVGFLEVTTIKNAIEYPYARYDLTILYKKVN